MIPAKIDDVFIQLTTDFSGVITNIDAGSFAKTAFTIQDSIYDSCPFLEGTLEALPLNDPFLLEGMVIVSEDTEYNLWSFNETSSNIAGNIGVSGTLSVDKTLGELFNISPNFASFKRSKT